MYPLVLLCEEYPKAVVQINGVKFALELVDKRSGLSMRKAYRNEESSCLLHLPYQGVYHVTESIEPLRGGDLFYLRVAVELENCVKVYNFRFSRGTVSMHVQNADESIFIGYVRKEQYHSTMKRLLTKVVRSYLLSTTPLCSFLIKMTHKSTVDVERLVSELDPDCASTIIDRKRLKVLYRPGLSIFIRRLSLTRTNVSVICSVAYSDKFSRYVLTLFDNCESVIELRFGRIESINGTVNLVLDVFTLPRLASATN